MCCTILTKNVCQNGPLPNWKGAIKKGVLEKKQSKGIKDQSLKLRRAAYPEHTKGEVPICLLWGPALKEVISIDQVTKESFNQHQSKMVYSQENPQVTGILAMYNLHNISKRAHFFYLRGLPKPNGGCVVFLCRSHQTCHVMSLFPGVFTMDVVSAPNMIL